MANEIRAKNKSGLTVYALLIRAVDGKIWNGTSFVSLLNANWSTYVIPMTEQGAAGIYFGNMPSVGSGLYDAWVYQRVGGTPASSDFLIGQASIDWDGFKEASLAGAQGSGQVMISHNFGGTDNLAYQTSTGFGIVDATIRVYLKTDYDSGNTGNNYIKGTTTTITGGRWHKGIFLDPAQYVVQFVKAGAYGPDTTTITVT